MFNRVTLLGNLGRDAQVTQPEGGSKVAALSVATHRTWKDANGERQRATDWHRVVAFGAVGEFASGLGKGQQVLVEGRLQTRQWLENDTRRYTTEVVARQILLVGPRVISSENEEPDD